jgi:hypothetical protein
LALFCVWTKSLVCKDAFIRDSTIQSDVRRFCTVFKSEVFRVPVSRPDDRAIPSRRPSVHCSIRPDDVPYCPDASQNKHHPSGRRAFSVLTSTVSRSYCSSLYPSGRLLVIDQLQIVSKFNLKVDCFIRPDDVDSHLDALIHKARIAIQISSSGRQSALVQTRVHQLRKFSIRLQPSGRLPIMVRMCA